MTRIQVSAPDDDAIVVVIDDDPSVRKALTNLLQSVGLNAYAFSSTSDFLAWPLPDAPICLVLDVRMPGQNGLDFQQELAKSHDEIPVVFITAHGDIPMCVRAIKSGAIEFLTKPFSDQDLLDAINAGLAKNRASRDEAGVNSELLVRYRSLSSREREVMDLVVKGQLTKQIAAKLNLSDITVKICRAHLMKKLNANSLLELGRMSERLERMKHRVG